MKVERQKEAFRPVIITLETQEEVNLITGLIGATKDSVSARFGLQGGGGNGMFGWYTHLCTMTSENLPEIQPIKLSEE